MARNNTATTPEEYIAAIEEPRRAQFQALYDLIREAAPSLEPHIIAGMIGFGKYRYKGKTCEGEWYKLGLSNNKSTLMFSSCGMMADGKTTIPEAYVDKLPKAKIGRSCINIKKLDDVDLEVLREIAKKTAEADFQAQVV
jgi:hypothetical protein